MAKIPADGSSLFVPRVGRALDRPTLYSALCFTIRAPGHLSVDPHQNMHPHLHVPTCRWSDQNHAGSGGCSPSRPKPLPPTTRPPPLHWLSLCSHHSLHSIERRQCLSQADCTQTVMERRVSQTLHARLLLYGRSLYSQSSTRFSSNLTYHN